MGHSSNEGINILEEGGGKLSAAIETRLLRGRNGHLTMALCDDDYAPLYSGDIENNCNIVYHLVKYASVALGDLKDDSMAVDIKQAKEEYRRKNHQKEVSLVVDTVLNKKLLGEVDK